MKKRWFESATPESVGISSDAIQKMIDSMYMTEKGREIHGFMLIRNSKVVAEGSFAPFDDGKHVIHSCSKAFTATAIGFAQDEGLLSIDDPIVKYLGDIAPKNPAPELQRLTIRHMLTMSNGHASNVFLRPMRKGAPEKLKTAFMAEGFKCEPGTKFAYDNTNSYILSEIVRRVSGLDVIEYLRPRLFDKLGIDPFYYTDANGMFVGYGGMRLTREEMARFGQFYMDGCVWEGERLLSKQWASEATRCHISTASETSTPGVDASDRVTDWNQGYAFHMWRGQHNSFRLCGAYGQICACYPDYNLILCVNSASNQTIQEVLDAFYKNILIPIKDTLPENPEAYERLCGRTKSLALSADFSLPSPMACAVSGKTWQLENCKEIASVSLDFSDDACKVVMNFKNGTDFTFDAGLKEIRKTDCYDTHVVSMQPQDYAVCAASGAWTEENVFCITARMIPTHTMFYLTFTFTKEGCELVPTMYRANEFGTVV